MSTFERLLAIASGQGEVVDLARSMIGEQELAVLAKRGVFELLVDAIYALRVLHKARGRLNCLYSS